jgi:hypothetical protein
MWATATRDYIDLCGDDTDAMLAITAGLGFHELHQGLADGTLDRDKIRRCPFYVPLGTRPTA